MTMATELLAKIRRAPIRLRTFGRPISSGNEERQTPRSLYLYFLIVAVGRLRQQGQQSQSPVEARDGFDMGRALGCVFASLQPPVNGAPRFARGRQVVGEHFGLSIDHVSEPLFQHCGDARM